MSGTFAKVKMNCGHTPPSWSVCINRPTLLAACPCGLAQTITSNQYSKLFNAGAKTISMQAAQYLEQAARA